MTENEQRLITALEYLDADDYREWIIGGMALKHEGLPLFVWDGWSRKSNKYTEGECARRWATFNETNAGRPVTGGTLLMLAKQRGYLSTKGTYTPTTQRNTTKHPEKISDVLPTNYRPEKIPALPAEYDPAADMKKYLSTLFRPDEKISYCDKLTAQTGKDGKTRFVPLQSTKHRTAGQIIEALSGGVSGAGICAQSEGGAFIRFNPMDGKGDSDANVTDFRFCLIESDTDAIEKQYGLYKALWLPIAVLVHSGNKSLHAITRVDAQNAEEYSERVRYIYDYCKQHGLHVDEADKNASRYSRLPGIKRGDRWQYIVDANLGAGSYAEWAAWAAVQPDPTDRHGPTDGGGFGWDDEVPPDGPIFSEIADQPPAPPAAAAEADPPNTIYSVYDFLKNQKDIEWFIDGIVQKDAFMMLFGASGSGKTFAALDIGLSIASEGIDTWHPYHAQEQHEPIYPKIKHGSVLYLTAEGEHGLRKRIAAWIQDRRKNYPNFDPQRINFHVGTFGLPLNDGEGEAALLEAIKAHAQKIPGGVPNLIILDTLIYYMNGDENSAQDARGLVDACQRVRKHLGDCSIMLIHHTGKDPEKQDDARGSSAFRGAMDVYIRVSGKIEDGGEILLKQTKNKDEEEHEIHTTARFVTMADDRKQDGSTLRSVVLTDYDLITGRDKPAKRTKPKNIPEEHIKVYKAFTDACDAGLGTLNGAGEFIGLTERAWRDYYADSNNRLITTTNTKKIRDQFNAALTWLTEEGDRIILNKGEPAPATKDLQLYLLEEDETTAPLIKKKYTEAAKARQQSETPTEEGGQEPPNAELFEQESPEGYSPTPKATKPRGKKKRS